MNSFVFRFKDLFIWKKKQNKKAIKKHKKKCKKNKKKKSVTFDL